MSRAPFILEGADELYSALGGLPKAVQRRTLEGVMTDALEPVAERVKANAPTLFGDLERDLHIGKKLNKRQASLTRRSKATAEIHFGTSDPAGIANEFGNDHQRAHPFFRSEWESGKAGVLNRIKDGLGSAIMAEANRRRARGRR